jgi:four helix bundle protein
VDHKDLDVRKKAMEVVLAMYKATAGFPKEELYGLTSQVRRAAVSVPSNIAEGEARNSDKEFTQFLHITLGSLAELETQWILADRLGFLSNNRSQFTVHHSLLGDIQPGFRS